MTTVEDIGKFKIYLPDENSKQFYIFCDLADLFNLEFQSDAVSLLRKQLKEIELKPKPNIDYEADRTSIRTGNYSTILSVARIVNQLSNNKEASDFDDENWVRLEEKFKNWKRPKPQEWKEDDIFSLPLKDGTFAFGQVLVKDKFKKTFALFDLKSDAETIDLRQLKKVKPITILHLLGTKLNDRSWKVIGTTNKLADPANGPWGDSYTKSGSANFLDSIANYYWFGETKWKEEEIKKLILKKKSLIDKIKNWW